MSQNNDAPRSQLHNKVTCVRLGSESVILNMSSVWVFLTNVVIVLATILVVMIVHPLGWVGLAILAAMFGGLP